jgi:hypothetical protein
MRWPNTTAAVAKLAREVAAHYEGTADEWAAIPVDARGRPVDRELRRLCRRMARRLSRLVILIRQPDEDPEPV